jgi:glycerol-3-phosphate dehydrogenase
MPPSSARSEMLHQIRASPQWDIVIAGGGATGLGAAVEAASRGYRTLLLEAEDFAKATSSRSTKLAHGGVRYLRQGNIALVREALLERGRMLRNAPHLVHPLAFAIPAYHYWELPFYAAGLHLYDALAGAAGIGRARTLSPARTLELLPRIRPSGLKGGILYCDGQFDDARYAIALLRTFLDLGGTALNYAPVTALLKSAGRITGVRSEDRETKTEFECAAKAVVNAAGIFSDRLRALADPAAKPALTVSQGSHVVLPPSWLPGNTALMIPRTPDGRVLFAIPWHHHVLVGTTDDPVPAPEYEPCALASERVFLLKQLEVIFGARPQPQEILSVWSGQRPLVREPEAKSTAVLSREHTVLISPSGLLTIIGGKWTTYRKMGQDVIDRAAEIAGLPRVPSRTPALRLHGYTDRALPENWQRVYGADLADLNAIARENPELDKPLHPDLPFRQAEVVWAARHEMARTLEDVLARRTRALFLNAPAAIQAAPLVARLLARELQKAGDWESQQISDFRALAQRYLWTD